MNLNNTSAFYYFLWFCEEKKKKNKNGARKSKNLMSLSPHFHLKSSLHLNSPQNSPQNILFSKLFLSHLLLISNVIEIFPNILPVVFSWFEAEVEFILIWFTSQAVVQRHMTLCCCRALWKPHTVGQHICRHTSKHIHPRILRKWHPHLLPAH